MLKSVSITQIFAQMNKWKREHGVPNGCVYALTTVLEKLLKVPYNNSYNCDQFIKRYYAKIKPKFNANSDPK